MKNNMKKGFTLVELLVVMTILAVLSFLAVPQFVRMQKQANEKTFEANHRMVISAINMYVADKDGKYPLATSWTTDVGKYISGKSPNDTLTNGLGQPGVSFSYKINSTTNTPELVSTLAATQTVDNAVKTMTYKAN